MRHPAWVIGFVLFLWIAVVVAHAFAIAHH
jgi:hypothetical protein